MIRRTLAFIPAVVMILSAPLFADDPPWVLLEKGRDAFERRDLTLALDTLLDTVEANPEYPEAEYWLGRVYESQGQLILAEDQYRRALDLSLYLRVPDDAVSYRYRLADLLAGQGYSRALEVESILTGLVDSEGASHPEAIAKDHQYIRILTETGIDELLYLYRDELGYSLKARRMLAEMSWNEGRYRSALLHSARAVISLSTTAANAYREYDPQWRFDIDPIADAEQPDRDVRYPGSSDGLIGLLDRAGDVLPNLLAWLDESGYWSQLYLLGVSLYAEGYVEAAESVWVVLAAEDEVDGRWIPRVQAGRWGRLAARQLEEPFLPEGSLFP